MGSRFLSLPLHEHLGEILRGDDIPRALVTPTGLGGVCPLCVCTCMCTCIAVDACEGAQSQILVSAFITPILFFEAGFLAEPRAR